ncbi:hypothetical protein [Acinetobacter oleivorans]|uniref:hypothetical protein n=1 Tax=Acinetobacter oleivorans TaxID=1148157 RepID=UPI00148EFFE4|nr:hypothetical protein [Acinetobacter oleivorans]
MKSDSRESHLQPAWYQSDSAFVILLFKSIEQVLQMAMVLPTFAETKVGRTEG